MAQTSTHTGSYQSIPDSASPGLVFLKGLLPILDSLDPESKGGPMTAALAPGATFSINGGPSLTTDQIRPMQMMRCKRVARFGHDVRAAWDVASGPGGARTVMYESVSTTVFNDDPQSTELPVAEFTVMELIPAAGTGGDGIAGLRAKVMRTYMNPAAVTQRAAMLFGQKE
jgi:hypothetical protein